MKIGEINLQILLDEILNILNWWTIEGLEIGEIRPVTSDTFKIDYKVYGYRQEIMMKFVRDRDGEIGLYSLFKGIRKKIWQFLGTRKTIKDFAFLTHQELERSSLSDLVLLKDKNSIPILKEKIILEMSKMDLLVDVFNFNYGVTQHGDSCEWEILIDFKRENNERFIPMVFILSLEGNCSFRNPLISENYRGFSTATHGRIESIASQITMYAEKEYQNYKD